MVNIALVGMFWPRVCDSCCELVCTVTVNRVGIEEPAKRRDTAFRVLVLHISLVSALCFLGAVPVAGGVSAPSVLRSPKMTP